MKKKNIKIAAISDIHLGKYNLSNKTFNTINKDADVLLIAGDITYRGRIEEAKKLLTLLRNTNTPVVAILGNHDYDNGKTKEIIHTLEEGGLQVLNGDVTVVKVSGLRIGLTGTKGHGGGFSPHRGCIRGEESTKAYMREEEQEVKKLRKGVSRLQQMKLDFRIALLHYSPYLETILGEPPELSLFMGSSRLADQIMKYPVDLVVHGHAHHGTGNLIKTREGVFACNVAQMLHQGKYTVFSIQKLSDKECVKVLS